jgi:colanic acid/amylovoran biosynthesis glycosyltransferase
MFLVEGPAMRSRLVELGCAAEKVCVHRIGVDLTNLMFRERNFVEPLTIIMVGRFVEKKGLVDGVQACALAARRGLNLKLTIVGGPRKGEAIGQRIEMELREYASHPALAGRVSFTGFLTLPETRDLVSKQHLFLSPSRHAANGDAEGGSPVILTEAMAQGLLCIGTRHCDIPEVIIDGETGFLGAEGKPEELAEILLSLPKQAPWQAGGILKRTSLWRNRPRRSAFFTIPFEITLSDPNRALPAGRPGRMAKFK